jgi:hypothetical protein
MTLYRTEELSRDERDACLAAILATFSVKQTNAAEVFRLFLQALTVALTGVGEGLMSVATEKVDMVKVGIPTLRALLGVEVEESGDATGFDVELGEDRDGAYTSVQEVQLYGALAVCLFALGKQMTEDNKTAFTEKRPQAVMGKYGVSADESIFLKGGKYATHPSVFAAIRQGAAIHQEIRSVLVRQLVHVSAQEFQTPELDVLVTIFKQLAGTQLAHVGAIADLILSQPWVLRMDELRPSLMSFQASMEAWMAMDPIERPYVRLLTSDHKALFPRRDMMPLIAVASAEKRGLESTFVQYQGGVDSYSGLVTKFKQLRAASGAPQGQGTDSLFAAFGLVGVPLPTVGEDRAKEDGTQSAAI